jgi:hypothetical protein
MRGLIPSPVPNGTISAKDRGYDESRRQRSRLTMTITPGYSPPPSPTPSPPPEQFDSDPLANIFAHADVSGIPRHDYVVIDMDHAYVVIDMDEESMNEDLVHVELEPPEKSSSDNLQPLQNAVGPGGLPPGAPLAVGGGAPAPGAAPLGGVGAPLHRERRWQLEEVLYRERLHSAEWLPLHRERRQRRFRQRLRWAPEAVRPRLQPVQAFCTIFRGNRSCGGFLA